MTPPSPHVEIKQAGPEDLPAIAAMAGIVWRAYYPGIISHGQIEYMLENMYNLRVLRRELNEGISFVQVFVDGTFTGFASYGAVAPGEIKLHKIYIHPDWHRHGLGSLLLSHVENACRQKGIRSLLLSVNKLNLPAIAAYQKNGFALRESVVTEIGQGFVMDDYIMAKNVGPS